ncbi:hypothetical protein P844_00921 [Klebsiella pneumoniae UCI 41]|nr:hypothetical protein P846_00921 [Klebsiella pneumoniae UCI 43]EWD20337.1 hypothetical protein P847_00923 [Klebsiella pneumoniae UCI 44]EWD27695.1 hypothetical protein P841_03459 [Klebsiella pneumoniae UCI 38]EWD29010.1 hypothetical protein P844_00921 [Klebsiella pneumoniae UCI 41]EWD38629.1 hypothetical protein P840_00919 [Klebsiella pneumoniae UCI 37]KDM10748.1 hypothetical protein AE14_00921 [Klebsiella pneumoniae UCI 55]OUI10924.1 LysR family transcriptional regulator [Klebsiella pneumo
MSQPLPNKNLPMPSLRNIQAFIEVAATGSLNLAAENLNITASAVSHQIAREGANKQVISSQADSLIKISRIWADFFPANTSNQPI